MRARIPGLSKRGDRRGEFTCMQTVAAYVFRGWIQLQVAGSEWGASF